MKVSKNPFVNKGLMEEIKGQVTVITLWPRHRVKSSVVMVAMVLLLLCGIT